MSRTQDLRNFEVQLPGIPGRLHYFAHSQEEANEMAERDMGRKPKAHSGAEAQAPAPKGESAEDLYARRERERADYKGPGQAPATQAANAAEQDFARRAAQTEASKS